MNHAWSTCWMIIESCAATSALLVDWVLNQLRFHAFWFHRKWCDVWAFVLRVYILDLHTARCFKVDCRRHWNRLSMGLCNAQEDYSVASSPFWAQSPFWCMDYNQSLMNGLLTLPDLLVAFPKVDTVHATGSQKAYNA